MRFTGGSRTRLAGVLMLTNPATLAPKHHIEAMPDGQGSVNGWVVDDSRRQTCNGDWRMNTTAESKLPERAPAVGELVHVRSRRWLVEEVAEPQAEGESAAVVLQAVLICRLWFSQSIR